jgi:hypothetical protein
MRNFWTKVKGVFRGLDTSEARKSVASDFRKASFALFGLFLSALPGAHHSAALALAKLLKVEEASLAVSSWTAAGLVFLSLVFRVAAFLLECDYGEADGKEKAKDSAKASEKKKKAKSEPESEPEGEEEEG